MKLSVEVKDLLIGDLICKQDINNQVCDILFYVVIGLTQCASPMYKIDILLPNSYVSDIFFYGNWKMIVLRN